MTPSRTLPSHHSVARPISPKDSANNASSLYRTILIPRLCLSICMLGNTRLLDLVLGRRLYRGGHLKIGMEIGGDGLMEQRSSQSWRFGNLRSRHILESMLARDLDPCMALQPRQIQHGGTQLGVDRHQPKNPASLQPQSHRLSISPCNLYQCTSSRPEIHPLI